MNTYKDRQKKLIQEMKKTFVQGESKSTVVEMRKNYADDPALCLTAIAHIPPEITQEIQEKIIQPLKAIDPKQYYYPSNSLHLTVKNIRTIHDPPIFTRQDIEKAKVVFAAVIPKHQSYTYELEDLLLLPTSLSLMGYTDEGLRYLVEELDQALIKNGVPDNKQYFSDSVFFGNITLCRFTRIPSSAFRQKINELQTIKIGAVEVEQIQLITTNAVNHPSFRKIIATYWLKD